MVQVECFKTHHSSSFPSLELSRTDLARNAQYILCNQALKLKYAFDSHDLLQIAFGGGTVATWPTDRQTDR